MIKIRKNVFETNSSSMHSLCVSKVSEYFTKEEMLTSCKLSDGNIVINSEDDLCFDRYPFYILASFYDKLRYVIPSFCDQNAENATKESLEKSFSEIINTVKEILPEIDGVVLPNSYYDEDEVSYGWIDHQSVGILRNYFEETDTSLKEFLTNKKYIIIVDGDEYEEWEKVKNSGIINVSIIESEYKTSDEDKEWLEYLANEDADNVE